MHHPGRCCFAQLHRFLSRELLRLTESIMQRIPNLRWTRKTRSGMIQKWMILLFPVCPKCESARNGASQSRWSTPKQSLMQPDSCTPPLMLVWQENRRQSANNIINRPKLKILVNVSQYSHDIVWMTTRHKIMQWWFFSDKVYWQVADQPGKEGPNYLLMDDSEDKEEKKVLSSSKRGWRGERNIARRKMWGIETNLVTTGSVAAQPDVLV